MKTARAILETTRGSGGTPTRLLYFDDGFVQQDVKTIRPQHLRQSYFGFYAASAGTVPLASCNATQVYVDPTTIGSTADNYWIDASWTLSNGYKNLYTLNNTTAAQDTFRPQARSWKLEGTRYYAGTVADAEWDA